MQQKGKYVIFNLFFILRLPEKISGWLHMKFRTDISLLKSTCIQAVTSPRFLHPRYYFWLSVLHLGAQWSLFHFRCHNAISPISPGGIRLLEKRITYVVSQNHPSSPYPTGADDQWVRWCQGLRTGREGRRRKKRVFGKTHLSLWLSFIFWLRSKRYMKPPSQNPQEEP